jgi:hypothetical protein
MRTALSLLMFVLLGLLASGCGGTTKYATRGRILKGGQPFHPPADETMRVTLVPIRDDAGQVTDWYAANYNAHDGTFTASGPDGKGVPPGKYRVCVEQLRNRNDVLRGALFGDKSPYIREIKKSSDEITIDLDKRE